MMNKFKVIIFWGLISVNINLFALDLTISNMSDTTKIEEFESEIDFLNFENVDIRRVVKLEGVKVKYLNFYRCLGNINDVLSIIDKSELVELNITECFFEDSSINIENIKINSLILSIANSKGIFEFNNLESIKSLYFFNSEILSVDFSRINKNANVISVINSSHIFSKNWNYISELSNLVRLRLEFQSRFKERLFLNNHKFLKEISLSNFTDIPILDSLTELESLILNNIFKIEYNALNMLFLKNIMIIELHIDNCNLTDIPKNISKLKNLEQLSLSGNKIQKFDYKLLKLKQLRTIYLDNNYISDFVIKNRTKTNLNQLNIEFNNLTKRIKIPEGSNIIINQKGNPFRD